MCDRQISMTKEKAAESGNLSTDTGRSSANGNVKSGHILHYSAVL
jgi:hypothetical protein